MANTYLCVSDMFVNMAGDINAGTESSRRHATKLLGGVLEVKCNQKQIFDKQIFDCKNAL